MEQTELKCLLFDIETTPHVSYTWGGKYDVNVVEFKKEGYIMCVAYKWLGQKQTYVYSLRTHTRKQLFKILWDLFNEADVLIAHNGKSFDVKMVNREFSLFGMKPPSQYKVIDTKTLAKSKFRFSSNKLDDLGEYLGLGRKIKTDFQLWIDCMHGDKVAYKKMERYNKMDVILLEKIYLHLRPFMDNHPHLDLNNEKSCPNCGSQNIKRRGWTYNGNTGFKKRKYVCEDCGKWSFGKGERIIYQHNVLK